MTKGYNGDKIVAKMHDESSKIKFLSHKGTIISGNGRRWEAMRRAHTDGTSSAGIAERAGPRHL